MKTEQIQKTEQNEKSNLFINKVVKRTETEKARIETTLNEKVVFRITTPIKTELNQNVLMVASLLEINTDKVKKAISESIGLSIDYITEHADDFDAVTQHNIRKATANFLKKFAKTLLNDSE